MQQHYELTPAQSEILTQVSSYISNILMTCEPELTAKYDAEQRKLKPIIRNYIAKLPDPLNDSVDNIVNDLCGKIGFFIDSTLLLEEQYLEYLEQILLNKPIATMRGIQYALDELRAKNITPRGRKNFFDNVLAIEDKYHNNFALAISVLSHNGLLTNTNLQNLTRHAAILLDSEYRLLKEFHPARLTQAHFDAMVDFCDSGVEKPQILQLLKKYTAETLYQHHSDFIGVSDSNRTALTALVDYYSSLNRVQKFFFPKALVQALDGYKANPEAAQNAHQVIIDFLKNSSWLQRFLFRGLS